MECEKSRAKFSGRFGGSIGGNLTANFFSVDSTLTGTVTKGQ